MHQVFLRTVSTLAVLLILFSCSTSEEIQPNSKRVRLNLNVVQFDVVPFTTKAASSVSEFCKTLHFVVFDAQGQQVSRTDQNVGDPNFGSVDIELESGSYTVVAVAHSSEEVPELTSRQVVFGRNDMSDVFFYKKTVTLDVEDKSLDVTLERATSMLRFMTEDAVPSEVTDISVILEKTSYELDLDAGLGKENQAQDMAYRHVFTDEEKGKPFKMEVYCLLNKQQKDISVRVMAYQESTLVKRRDFSDVPMEKNKITVCKGAFFAGDHVYNSRKFAVKVNAGWQNETNEFSY